MEEKIHLWILGRLERILTRIENLGILIATYIDI